MKWTKPGLHRQPSQLESVAESLKEDIRRVENGTSWLTHGMHYKYIEGFVEGLKHALWIAEGEK